MAKARVERAAANLQRFAIDMPDTAKSDEGKRLCRKVPELEVEREISKRSMALSVKETHASECL